MLLVLEHSLVNEFRISATFPERGTEMDAALQAYVDYLHILGCPPEHVVLHIKRRLEDATARSGETRGKEERAAIVLRAIEIYFGAP
jgi:hypothetical protein